MRGVDKRMCGFTYATRIPQWLKITSFPQHILSKLLQPATAHQNVGFMHDVIYKNNHAELFFQVSKAVILVKLSTINNKGLPYEIIFVVYKPYLIIANIDVADGLANGAVDKLSYVELGDQNRVLWLWLLFPNSVGVKARGKVTGYANGIGREMVPINRRFATIPPNQNRSVHAKKETFLIETSLLLDNSQIEKRDI
ncbi:ATP-dependent DNA helicase [Trichonephila clavipes]|nr:ATP-dependent DNA helicase [Trichonephila clavipes]